MIRLWNALLGTLISLEIMFACSLYFCKDISQGPEWGWGSSWRLLIQFDESQLRACTVGIEDPHLLTSAITKDVACSYHLVMQL